MIVRNFRCDAPSHPAHPLRPGRRGGSTGTRSTARMHVLTHALIRLMATSRPSRLSALPWHRGAPARSRILQAVQDRVGGLPGGRNASVGRCRRTHRRRPMCAVAASVTPPRTSSHRGASMELIENLPLGEYSTEMAATIKSEMPQQDPPVSAVSDSSAASEAQPAVPVGGILQQLYEQQQIFAYHAQQAQQAHLSCAQLVRAGAATPGDESIAAQVRQLAALRTEMLGLQKYGSASPSSLPGEKRNAGDGLSEPDDNKRQRVEPAADVSITIHTAGDVPTYTDDVTGLGLSAPTSQVCTYVFGSTRSLPGDTSMQPCAHAERSTSTCSEDPSFTSRDAEKGSNCSYVRRAGQPRDRRCCWWAKRWAEARYDLHTAAAPSLALPTAALW